MPPPADSSGQASVEFAAVLPVVLFLLAGAWQCVLAAHCQWSASAAARAAARAHAVGRSELSAARRALPDSLDRRVRVSSDDSGRVAVHVRVPTIVPALSLGTLTARATFADQR